MRWIAPDSFVVSGLGLTKGHAFHRSYLRFKSAEEASLAATIIKRNSSVLEEPLVPVEEFPVQVRLLLSSNYLTVVLSGLLVRLIITLFILRIAYAFGILGLLVGAVVIIGYVGFPMWVVFGRARRQAQGWIRFEARSIVVRGLEWTPIVPKTIEWKSPRVIVLSGRGTKHELSFPTAKDLTSAVTKIRTAFPQVQEILSKNYQPGVDSTHA